MLSWSHLRCQNFTYMGIHSSRGTVPDGVCSTPTLACFSKRLKLYLFKKAFPTTHTLYPVTLWYRTLQRLWNDDFLKWILMLRLRGQNRIEKNIPDKDLTKLSNKVVENYRHHEDKKQTCCPMFSASPWYLGHTLKSSPHTAYLVAKLQILRQNTV